MPTPIIPPQPLMVSIRRDDAMIIIDLIDRLFIYDKHAREGEPGYTTLTPEAFDTLGELYSRIDMALNPE